jgi:hypothetical protein
MTNTKNTAKWLLIFIGVAAWHRGCMEWSRIMKEGWHKQQ